MINHVIYRSELSKWNLSLWLCVDQHSLNKLQRLFRILASKLLLSHDIWEKVKCRLLKKLLHSWVPYFFLFSISRYHFFLLYYSCLLQALSQIWKPSVLPAKEQGYYWLRIIFYWYNLLMLFIAVWFLERLNWHLFSLLKYIILEKFLTVLLSLLRSRSWLTVFFENGTFGQIPFCHRI